MGAETLTDISLPDSYETEWRIVGEHSCNVLLEGTVTATNAVMRLLQPQLGEPIRWHRPHEPLDLSKGQTRTLILRDAAALSEDDQRRLLAWSRDTGSGIRIISMTTRPLFALVAAGVFDAALYYRLNVVLLRVEAPQPIRTSL
jgi:hypothetical protein